MRRKKMHSIQSSAFLLGAALSATWPAAAHDAKQSYASMAPVEQYLMDRDAEIALARSGRELRVFSFFPAIFAESMLTVHKGKDSTVFRINTPEFLR